SRPRGRVRRVHPGSGRHGPWQRDRRGGALVRPGGHRSQYRHRRHPSSWRRGHRHVSLAGPMTALGDLALDSVAELADRIAAAVTGCPGVAGLTQIPGMPVATYLRGRTMSGVAVRPAEVEICVAARY